MHNIQNMVTFWDLQILQCLENPHNLEKLGKVWRLLVCELQVGIHILTIKATPCFLLASYLKAASIWRPRPRYVYWYLFTGKEYNCHVLSHSG